MNQLYCGNVLDVLPKLKRHFNCLIADPPDNIGLVYHEYVDSRTKEEYMQCFETCMVQFVGVADVVWISFNAKWIFEVGGLLSRWHPHWDARLFIQIFTFGQNRKTDCGNGYRPILRIMRPEAKLYPDAIKVESWRQKHGDKRAAPGGCVPLDVWDFPRITGNCKERRSWHPTQLREAMIQRMVDFSTIPGDSVCDAFSGTGTVLRAVKDRSITSIELDRGYCDRIAAEHDLEVKTL